jgi:hypothetical protein
MEVFGSPDVWCKVHNLLESKKESKEKDECFNEFRKSYSDQCNMTALTVSTPGFSFTRRGFF